MIVLHISIRWLSAYPFAALDRNNDSELTLQEVFSFIIIDEILPVVYTMMLATDVNG
jgi:hypothetical protein